MRKLQYILMISLLSATLLSGCKKTREEIDLSGIHTTAETETMAPEKETTTAPEITIPETEEATTTAASANATVTSTPTRITSYQSGRISIQYPEIYDTSDASKESAINQLLKDNALAIVTAYQMDGTKDTLDITCEVITASKTRLTVKYTGIYTPDGAAYPTNIFFTNTVDLNKVSNIRLNDYADPYTMAGYVLSGDCQFIDVTSEQLAQLMKIKNDTTLSQYTELFTNADFPMETDFPRSFSYEKQGNIYFSIPVAHALGDYAVIKFTPDTK